MPINLKAKITPKTVVYSPRKKGNKKATLWAAWLNNQKEEAVQLPLFNKLPKGMNDDSR